MKQKDTKCTNRHGRIRYTLNKTGKTVFKSELYKLEKIEKKLFF